MQYESTNLITVILTYIMNIKILKFFLLFIVYIFVYILHRIDWWFEPTEL